MVPEINQVKWPGWETHNMIGQGSFGAVYEIQRDVFGETERAALKVISIPQSKSELDEMYSEGYDEDSIQMNLDSQLKAIVSEYSMMRKLNGCSNVVHCDDVRYEKKSDGIGWNIYIKMELLTPLSKVLPTSITDETVIRIGKDICNALERCNMFGIVHRDIKPQNLFVSETGEFKLGDFGIAKTIEKTTGGTKIGTFKYMAPEVYHSQPYGSSADIYSLGLVLYWLLNERRMPFVPLPPAPVLAGVDGEAGNKRLMGAPIPAPKSGSTELKRIVLKACAYHPKDRFINAAEMRQALEQLDRIPALTTPTAPFLSVSLKPAEEETVRVRKPSHPDDTVRVRQTPDDQNATPIPSESIPNPSPKKKKIKPKLLIAVFCIMLVIAGVITAICLIPKSYNSDIFGKVTVGDYITFGSYEQDNNLDNGKEAIEWLVIDIKDKKALVISKYALDCQPYHKAAVDVTWETCSLRKWLNEEFIYEAFSAEEQTKIPTVTVSPDKNNVTSSVNGNIPVSASNPTQDKIFLLNADEYDEHLHLDCWMCTPTAYAIAQGTAVSDNTKCSWWLRTPGETQVSAAYIEKNGGRGSNSVSNCYSSVANTLTYGIRPMLWINLDSSDIENPLPEKAANTQLALPRNIKIGDTITYGTYEQDNSVYTGEEDIEWLVLDIQDRKALIISKYILDSMCYHSYDSTETKWENCSLRNWLNHNFIKLAFTEAEQARIPEVTLSTDIDISNLACKTNDKVFLLSADEIATYFNSKEDKIGTATDYAIARTAISDYSYYGDIPNSNNRSIDWWLRSHNHYGYNDNTLSLGISSDGALLNTALSSKICGIRPAMWIQLDTNNGEDFESTSNQSYCSHIWENATFITPKLCVICGESEGIPRSIDDIDIGTEVEKVRNLYYKKATPWIDGEYRKESIRDGVNAFYDNDGELVLIFVEKGTPGIEGYSNTHERTYYYEDGKLIFVLLEGKDEHRLYFWDELLIRWRYRPVGGTSEDDIIYDFSISDSFMTIESLVLSENRSFFTN